MTDPATYAAWYEAPRGAWIGSREFSVLRELLALGTHESVLDVGCGTGYFTTRLAQHTDGHVTGLDPNATWLRYAAEQGPKSVTWVEGRAEKLPFADQSFDVTVSVSALCFIADQEAALREMVRVTRRRLALGLLNRHSVLWWQMGRHGGVGGYRGARWHTAQEVHRLLSACPCRGVRIRSAVFIPSGSRVARGLENWLPRSLPWGAFLAAVADIAQPRRP